ncbi:MAG: DUF885 family protein [Vicinamibacterales bacterium]
MCRRVRHALVLLAVVACAGAGCTSSAPPPHDAPETFDAFVDAVLDHFASHHPSIAAGNGLHQYDDRLEDFSASAVAGEIDGWKALHTRLEAIPADDLPPDERVDHRIVGGLVEAWLLDLDVNRSWQKNLMIYASAISDGVHNLMTMASAPAEVRAQRIVAKLRGVPALLEAAKANITDPPRVMAERGVRMLRGASAMLATDMPLAFADLADAEQKGALLAAGAEAAQAIDAFVAWFEQEKLPSAAGRYQVGRERLEARYRAEELIDTPVPQLLAIGERELAVQEAAFTAAAAAVDPRRPALAVWQDVQKNHPPRGGLVAAAQAAVDELQAFVTARGLVTLPEAERVTVAAAPPFDLGLASMHSSPPLEPTPVASYFYVTDARPEWDA